MAKKSQGGRPVLPPRKRLERVISFRVRIHESNALDVAARAAKQTAPVWARTVVLKAVGL